jgi:hypothetical protein
VSDNLYAEAFVRALGGGDLAAGTLEPHPYLGRFGCSPAGSPPPPPPPPRGRHQRDGEHAGVARRGPRGAAARRRLGPVAARPGTAAPLRLPAPRDAEDALPRLPARGRPLGCEAAIHAARAMPSVPRSRSTTAPLLALSPGTLAHRFIGTAAEGRVHAKTGTLIELGPQREERSAELSGADETFFPGTMSGVSALSGYLDHADPKIGEVLPTQHSSHTLQPCSSTHPPNTPVVACSLRHRACCRAGHFLAHRQQQPRRRLRPQTRGGRHHRRRRRGARVSERQLATGDR